MTGVLDVVVPHSQRFEVPQLELFLSFFSPTVWSQAIRKVDRLLS